MTFRNAGTEQSTYWHKPPDNLIAYDSRIVRNKSDEANLVGKMRVECIILVIRYGRLKCLFNIIGSDKLKIFLSQAIVNFVIFPTSVQHIWTQLSTVY